MQWLQGQRIHPHGLMGIKLNKRVILVVEKMDEPNHRSFL